MGHQQLIVVAAEGLACPIFVEIDNGKAGMAEAHACIFEVADAETIRAAMHLDGSHVDQQLSVNGLLRIVVKDSSDSTHRSDHIHHAVGAVHQAGEQRHS